jgi:hypothetical protein
VWRAASDGSLSVFAGDGSEGFVNGPAPVARFHDLVTTITGGKGKSGSRDGTGGPDGTAQLDAPQGLLLDGKGTLFVVDYGNDCIRAVTL